MGTSRNQTAIMRWLRYGLCGALIGAGAILPGVSGGVLAVVFDIYRPLMAVLTHPKTALPKYWPIFPPLGIGWALGFLLFAKGISAALSPQQAKSLENGQAEQLLSDPAIQRLLIQLLGR